MQFTEMKYASLISLGCAKNLVDSETMVKQLLDMGYRMTEELPEAELIVVNTCGFLESAVQEAIEAILQAARAQDIRKMPHAGRRRMHGPKVWEKAPERTSRG